MSTSATITFKSHLGDVYIYRYTDGYPAGPEGIIEKFGEFCRSLSNQWPTAEQLFARPGWLAVEYVVWCHSQDSMQRCSIDSVAFGAGHHYEVHCSTFGNTPHIELVL